mmetsp:Transcript_10879/g.9790  ORF Transcript_10879/g.9790 Transcript_10879/m.9790 type:complete len:102 (+) Transcript_10879:113-418(+)|eukprot:CAMPEP_0196764754 /NCGR_PEP_ID=MMETSP1095-20130614/6793_1 /TAXON_ID=96789 ORGANISM="Chromulina nebulosa, Strain UTEXLB2642" /NCGR_SAMPLE_ID=MMETSP1095 /ASSEMBLY_ACC=CAM_ASM_000446 /LENGTH=101 /DNA_ID=CAMNT_0042121117 /DNA_START=90 /DNA_END=395 /DNA_ORIENTATION=+
MTSTALLIIENGEIIQITKPINFDIHVNPKAKLILGPGVNLRENEVIIADVYLQGNIDVLGDSKVNNVHGGVPDQSNYTTIIRSSGEGLPSGSVLPWIKIN